MPRDPADPADGRVVFAKTRPGAPADFFRTEADGLRRLGAAGGAPVPAVLDVTDDALVLEWIEPGRPTPAAAEEFGRALAATHAAGAEHFGGTGDGYLGSLRLPNRPAATWPELYAEQRVGAALKHAVDRGRIDAADAALVEQVLAVLPAVAGPAEPPALLHGDLWAGNVHWSAAGPAYLIDPAVHGGHRETDLAMLALFGCPLLERILAAYGEAFPLGDGWRDRVALHQLHPVVVHAALFGGGYGAQAGRLARAVLRTVG
ncbi:fructosamine kinase family protein [Sporichthya brevicatena]|uniref:Fructosamine kinase family protein n=1 Tax=Sporichthya brevicatena TaxID=171442 RepID=A0ABN1GUQ0_9ACTN